MATAWPKQWDHADAAHHLARLAREPDLSQCELATIAEVSPISIARLIDRLRRLAWSNAAPIRQIDECGAAAALKGRAPAEGAQPGLQHAARRRNQGDRALVLSAMTRGLRQMKENVIRCRAANGSS